MRKYILPFLLLATFSAAAQPSPVLEQYLQTGLSNNLMLQQKELDIRKSMEAVRQAKALFMPRIQLNANYTVAAGGRKIDFPIGDLLNPVYSTLNQLTQSNAFPTVQNEKIQFLPNNFQETKIKFSYPLFNSDLKYNQRIKELLLQSQTAQKEAYAKVVRYEISEAYLQYIQTFEAEKIWTGARSVLLEMRRFNESLVKNNVATKDIIANADYEISKADHEIFNLQSQRNTARAYFNFLINRDLQSDVTVDSTLLTTMVPNYELQPLVQAALQNRKELEALEAGRKAGMAALDLNEANKKLPDFYIGGETGFQGYGYHFKDQAFVLAQVGLTYDIYSGGANNSKIQEARIENDKIANQTEMARQQIALQVTDAFNALSSAKNALETSKTGLKAAEEAFRIINNKYRAGQALLLEYMDAQNRVTIARIQVLLANTDVVKAHWKLAASFE